MVENLLFFTDPELRTEKKAQYKSKPAGNHSGCPWVRFQMGVFFWAGNVGRVSMASSVPVSPSVVVQLRVAERALPWFP